MKALLAAIWAVCVLAAPLPQQAGKDRKQIELSLYFKYGGWTLTEPTPDDPKSNDPTLTHAVFQLLMQSVDPVSGEPYDEAAPQPTCDPADLRVRFRLEKKEFLLGEPILVELGVQLDGPGHYPWSIGGNSNARGRDDNFTFIMRRADGSIVADPYGKEDFSLGGILSGHDVKRGSPSSQWLAVQRWCAIDQPGAYDLYCISGNYHQQTTGEVKARTAALPEELRREVYIGDNGELMDVGTGKPSNRYQLALRHQNLDSQESPLRKELPPDIAPPNSGFGAVAHFKITIRPGTEEENERMVDRWLKDIEPASARAHNMMGAGRQDAAFEAIWFARQGLFIPEIARWLSDPELSSKGYLDALAMRPDQIGMQLLERAQPAQAVNAFDRLDIAEIPEAIPLCIEWLTNPDNTVRADAEACLIRWTHQSFDHNWPGYHYQRPTLEEGQAMQVRWREWWKHNKDSFAPGK
jgi:hypothetical protein